jgi:hypothetical protein
MNSSDFSSQPMEIQNAVKAKAGTWAGSIGLSGLGIGAEWLGIGKIPGVGL